MTFNWNWSSMTWKLTRLEKRIKATKNNHERRYKYCTSLASVGYQTCRRTALSYFLYRYLVEIDDMKRRKNPMFDILFCHVPSTVTLTLTLDSIHYTQILYTQETTELGQTINWNIAWRRKTSCLKLIATSLNRRTSAIACWYYYYY